MKCERCGFINNINKEYCFRCGSPLRAEEQPKKLRPSLQPRNTWDDRLSGTSDMHNVSEPPPMPGQALGTFYEEKRPDAPKSVLCPENFSGGPLAGAFGLPDVSDPVSPEDQVSEVPVKELSEKSEQASNLEDAAGQRLSCVPDAGNTSEPVLMPDQSFASDNNGSTDLHKEVIGNNKNLEPGIVNPIQGEPMRADKNTNETSAQSENTGANLLVGNLNQIYQRVTLRKVNVPNLEKRLRILITGGYGFIGAAVADRSHQEGHRIYILDNLSTGSKKRVSFRHFSYLRSIEDPECEEIFKNNHFDIVIHAASGENQGSNANKAGDGFAGSHIAGLVNLLELSSKYGVKKFMLISSEAVYGKNNNVPFVEESLSEPTGFYGINKLTEEFYCRKWHETYGLPSVIFRVSQVYGPKETGAAMSPITRAVSSNTIQIATEGAQCQDYIYIGDVVDAVYRSIYRETSNILNLSTNTETSIVQLAEVLKKSCPMLEIIKENNSRNQSGSCRLDNTRAMKELGWEPRYSLTEGVAKTLQWRQRHPHWSYEEVAATREIAEPKERWPWLPYLENGLAFILVVAWVNLIKNNADYNMLDVKIIYIIMMGIMYGMVHSMIAVSLSIVLYFAMALSLGNDLISMINHPISLTQIIIYIVIGLYTGYTTDRRNREIASKELKLTELKEKNVFITELNHQNNLIQEELQNQIINFEDSYGKIYSVTREIDSLEPENIFNASIGLMENVMKSDAVSLYLVDKTGQYLRLIAKSKQLDLPKSVALDQMPDLAELMITKDIWVNRSFKPNQPVLMAPILDEDKVVAIVSLYNLKFENNNLYYRNLFKVLVGFISSSLLRAYRYEEATYVSRCVNETSVLNEESFKRILQLRTEAKSKNILQYSVLKVEGFDIQNETLLDKLEGLIREVDYMGHWNRDLYVLLANANRDEARNIINRFQNIGLHAAIINDEGELF